jgi:hypothetical protein
MSSTPTPDLSMQTENQMAPPKKKVKKQSAADVHVRFDKSSSPVVSDGVELKQAVQSLGDNFPTQPAADDAMHVTESVQAQSTSNDVKPTADNANVSPIADDGILMADSVQTQPTADDVKSTADNDEIPMADRVQSQPTADEVKSTAGNANVQSIVKDTPTLSALVKRPKVNKSKNVMMLPQEPPAPPLEQILKPSKPREPSPFFVFSKLHRSEVVAALTVDGKPPRVPDVAKRLGELWRDAKKEAA